MIPSQPQFPEMIGGKMVGVVLASMIADIKRVSQVLGGFKSANRSEVSQVLGTKFCHLMN